MKCPFASFTATKVTTSYLAHLKSSFVVCTHRCMHAPLTSSLEQLLNMSLSYFSFFSATMLLSACYESEKVFESLQHCATKVSMQLDDCMDPAGGMRLSYILFIWMSVTLPRVGVHTGIVQALVSLQLLQTFKDCTVYEFI